MIVRHISFTNDKKKYDFLTQNPKPYSKGSVLIDIKNTKYYHFALLKFLLDKHFNVTLINPKTTDLARKLQGSITKNKKLNALTICDVLDTPQRENHYQINHITPSDLHEQKQITRQPHHFKKI